jgi:ribosome-binding protein aMBF1 (putative translation factor)
MSHQDWEQVVLTGKKPIAKGPPKVEIQNRVDDQQRSQNMKNFKLENETDVVKIPIMPDGLAREIQQKRCAAKLTQKEIAQKMNTQANTIQEIESGKALWNQETKKLVNQLERTLGVKFEHKK